MTFQPGQQAYAQSMGTSSTANRVVETRDPTSNDTQYPIGFFWVNTNNVSLWYLSALSSSGGVLQATWQAVEAALNSLSDTANVPVYPSAETATPPSNIQLTNLDGSLNIVSDPGNYRIVISANNTGTAWSVVTTNQDLSDNVGFFANGGSRLDFTLPATSSVGDTYEVVAMSANGWRIVQRAGQQVTIGGLSSTLGAGGSVAFTAQGDWIQLVCSVANTNWIGCLKSGVATIV